MSNEIQNEEFILKGDLGSCTMYGEKRPITQVVSKENAVTITISGSEYLRLNDCPITEDTEFEEVKPLLIEDKK